MTISTTNLDAPLGAEVSGVDLSKPVARDDIATIEGLWRDRLVVVFHGQKLSDPQLIAFSRNFGELDPPGPNPYGEPFNRQHPELNVISNVVEAGKPIGNLGDGEAVWHADMTYVDVPPKAALLYSLEVPPTGGNTYFANMFAAYQAMPPDLKKAAEGRIAVHDGSTNSASMLRKGYKKVTDVRETVGAHHPLIRKEPDTGRKALFLGRRPNAYVLGLDVPKARPCSMPSGRTRPSRASQCAMHGRWAICSCGIIFRCCIGGTRSIRNRDVSCIAVRSRAPNGSTEEIAARIPQKPSSSLRPWKRFA